MLIKVYETNQCFDFTRKVQYQYSVLTKIATGVIPEQNSPRNINNSTSPKNWSSNKQFYPKNHVHFVCLPWSDIVNVEIYRETQNKLCIVMQNKISFNVELFDHLHIDLTYCPSARAPLPLALRVVIKSAGIFLEICDVKVP